MSKNLVNSFNRNGAFTDVLYYSSVFDTDVVPSTYGCDVFTDVEDKRFCMRTMTYDYLANLFPDYEVVVNEVDNIYESNSSASKNKERKILCESGYTARGYVDANRILIDYRNKAVFTIALNTIGVVYDPTIIKDIRGYCEDIYSKLPTTTETVKDDSNPYIGYITFCNGRYDVVEAEINSVELDIDKNYNDDFKPIYNDIVNFLDENNRKSGIVLLNGEPGTGKTYFLRHLINTVNGNYIFITPAIATHFSSPDFITFLQEHRDTIYILEDCEDVIMSRETRMFTGIQGILNMSDGLMSDIFNGKFICTFNCDMAKVDDAVLRKGRCAAVYTFDKLNKDKAQIIMKELGYDVEVKEDMTHAEIYNYESTNVPSTQRKNKVGF